MCSWATEAELTSYCVQHAPQRAISSIDVSRRQLSGSGEGTFKRDAAAPECKGQLQGISEKPKNKYFFCGFITENKTVSTCNYFAQVLSSNIANTVSDH